MTTVLHLQNALNRVIDEVKNESLDNFVKVLLDRIDDLDNDKVKHVLDEFKASTPNNILNFGPKKREKKTRPPNSYNLFIKDKMREIKDAHPEYKGKELMKKATEEWNKQKKEKEEREMEIENANE